MRALLFLVSLLSAAPVAADEILVIGDSIMAFHRRDDAAIANTIEDTLGRGVENLAVGGSHISGGNRTPISQQYVPGNWAWVVMDGGANDLKRECRCQACDGVMNELISEDGQSGEIPDLVNQIRSDGPNVMMMGYYNGNERGGGFDQCFDELAELDRRVSLLADASDGVFFADTSLFMGVETQQFYHRDNVHPSPEGSAAIGLYLSVAILEAEAEIAAAEGQ